MHKHKTYAQIVFYMHIGNSDISLLLQTPNWKPFRSLYVCGER
jgi:hypothetical protein